jgi:alcohol dehydrogenase class IV
MDALTHSIEAYISAINDEKSANYSITSVKNIFENLPLVYSDGKNANARLKMANASTNAGLAFNRTGLGHVHAISHQLTAFY